MLITPWRFSLIALLAICVSTHASANEECVSGNKLLESKSIAIGGRDGEKLRHLTESYIFSIPEEMENIAEVDVLGPCGPFSHQLLFPKELEEDVFKDMILGYRFLLEDDPDPEDILIVGLSPLADGDDLKVGVYYENRAVNPPTIYRLTFQVTDGNRAVDPESLIHFSPDDVDYLDSIQLLNRLRKDEPEKTKKKDFKQQN